MEDGIDGLELREMIPSLDISLDDELSMWDEGTPLLGSPRRQPGSASRAPPGLGSKGAPKASRSSSAGGRASCFGRRFASGVLLLGAAAAALVLLHPDSPYSKTSRQGPAPTAAPTAAPTPPPPPPPPAPLAPERPNLILMLVDDLGYADMEWTTTDLNGTALTLAGLAANGTILTNVYAQYQCSPTRAALMTGRYPARFGFQDNVLDSKDEDAVPRNESTVAEHLKDLGYRTLMAGKWHIGCSRWEFTPTGRGFDDFVGFMCSGDIDYVEKTNDDYYDFFDGRDFSTSVGENASWSGTLYGDAFERWRDTADPDDERPIFVYFAAQDPHGPLMAQEKYYTTGICADMANEDRQLYCGMIRALDEQTDRLVTAMGEERMNNTVFFMLSDNGGTPNNGGYNYPLRGTKGSMFDGGCKQVSFMWAGAGIRRAPAPGSVSEQPLHAVDFFNTLLRLAAYGSHAHDGGYAPPVREKTVYPKDSIDFWDAIVEDNPADDTPVEHASRTTTTTTAPWRAPRRSEVPIWIGTDTGVLRMGDMKLMYAVENEGWYPPPAADGSTTEIDGTGCDEDGRRSRRGGDGCYFLFDLSTDPNEQTNLYYTDSYASVVSTMTARIFELGAEATGGNEDENDDGYDAEDYAGLFGFWGPFLSYYDPWTAESTTSAPTARPTAA